MKYAFERLPFSPWYVLSFIDKYILVQRSHISEQYHQIPETLRRNYKLTAYTDHEKENWMATRLISVQFMEILSWYG